MSDSSHRRNADGPEDALSLAGKRAGRSAEPQERGPDDQPDQGRGPEERRVRGSGRGYLRFPKSLYDSLLLALPSAALLKTALAVVRLTIGHHDQASARISATTIADRSGLARDTVIRALRQLRHEGVLVRVSESKGRRAAEWRIDPEPAHWGRYHVAVENAVACDERPEVAGFAWTAEPSS